MWASGLHTPTCTWVHTNAKSVHIHTVWMKAKLCITCLRYSKLQNCNLVSTIQDKKVFWVTLKVTETSFDVYGNRISLASAWWHPSPPQKKVLPWILVCFLAFPGSLVQILTDFSWYKWNHSLLKFFCNLIFFTQYCFPVSWHASTMTYGAFLLYHCYVVFLVS